MAVTRFWSALGAVIVAGCSGNIVNPDTVAPVAAEPGRAAVIGWGATAAENARASVTPAQGTRVTMLVVSAVGDQKVPLSENVARLPPGNHELTIACGLYEGYRYFTHASVIQATLGAGRVYRLRADPQGRRCQPFLEDATAGG